MRKKLVVIGLIAFLIWTSCQRRTEHEQLKDNIRLENRIFDNIGLLTQVQKEDIFISIQALEKKIGSQIAIVIIDTLDGKTLETYSLTTFEEMGLGRKEFKDGVLITIVYKEHKIRIEVGYGLEKILKDEIASQIIKDEMTPRFKEQKFYEGIKDAVNRIEELIEKNKQLIGQMP